MIRTNILYPFTLYSIIHEKSQNHLKNERTIRFQILINWSQSPILILSFKEKVSTQNLTENHLKWLVVFRINNMKIEGIVKNKGVFVSGMNKKKLM